MTICIGSIFLECVVLCFFRPNFKHFQICWTKSSTDFKEYKRIICRKNLVPFENQCLSSGIPSSSLAKNESAAIVAETKVWSVSN